MTETCVARMSPPQSAESGAQTVTAHVMDGFQGACRVVSMLRSRRYDVRHLAVDVSGSVSGRAVLSCVVAITGEESRLLLERLYRLPAVIRAAID